MIHSEGGPSHDRLVKLGVSQSPVQSDTGQTYYVQGRGRFRHDCLIIESSRPCLGVRACDWRLLGVGPSWWRFPEVQAVALSWRLGGGAAGGGTF